MITPETIRSLRLLHDQVLVEVPHPQEKKLASGIILPPAEKVAEKNVATGIEGTIVAIGRGRVVGKRFVETQGKKGQRVLFPNHAGEHVPQCWDGGAKSDFFKIYDDEILCVVEGDGEIVGIAS
jgi:co-chaperonin GroES (HSP10)